MLSNDPRTLARLEVCSPIVVDPCGGGWALRYFACRDRMTIDLPGHHMSVTLHYCTTNVFNLIRVVVYSFFIVSKKLNVMFMFRPPQLMIVYMHLFWSAVLC